MSPLHQLAKAVGLQIDWHDAAGGAQRVSDDNLRRVLAALGYPAEDERDAAESLTRCQEEEAGHRFISAEAGQPITLPLDWAEAAEAELVFEKAGSQKIQLERGGDGWNVPPLAEIGYHTLSTNRTTVTLAIAPKSCIGIDQIAPGRKLWGVAAQIPSLRDDKRRAYGDYGALADAGLLLTSKAGAAALAVSPTHALFPADPNRFSPYAPSSRLFHNINLADPSTLGHPLDEAASPDLIAWQESIPQRLAALRAAYEDSWASFQGSIAAYRAKKGAELEHHATFDALYAHFLPTGAHGWQGWPAEYHDPCGEAVHRFREEHREDIDFYIFCQWLAHENLDAAHRQARANGMVIGLIADLAVGVDGGGSQAWSLQGQMLGGLSIGAPPDLLGPDGQDWGLTTFSPAGLKRTGFAGFIATIRAALEHAGGVRIDHALGLNRLWVIPHGGTAADGAYLKYPLDDMLRILAIESHRANAVVIGEDLGTVPDGLRPKLEDAGILGMRVLPFERDHEGNYIRPEQWQQQAVAMTGTHDLSTIAGWWQGRDIEWTWQLGRSSSHDSEDAEKAGRADERKRLWQALEHSGAAQGALPPADEPERAVDAAVAQVAKAACDLAIIPLEDLVGVTEQPNLPGTIDEHPNWRRRMPDTTENLLERPEVQRRITILNESRP